MIGGEPVPLSRRTPASADLGRRRASAIHGDRLTLGVVEPELAVSCQNITMITSSLGWCSRGHLRSESATRSPSWSQAHLDDPFQRPA